MEMLDENEIEKLTALGCSPIFDCTQHLKCILLDPCAALWCRVGIPRCGHLLDPWCKVGVPRCGHLFDLLTEDLKACGDGFYIKCPGFDRIERHCEFEPAIDAAKWKEKVRLDKVAELESRIKGIELEIKKRG
jgi:hypothetical protein